MTFKLEYHRAVQRWIPATVALFGLSACFVFFVPTGAAQINSASASMGSSGSGGHAATGASASVTSFGHHGFTPSHSGSTFTTHVPTHSNGGHSPQRYHQDSNSGRGFTYPYLYLYPVPYAVPDAADDSTADAEDDSDYQGGPTVFDRRGSGADSYIPPPQDAPPPHSSPAADPSEPESPQDPTTLVFKDGHLMEVGNYAIVGQTLYDLTPGHPRKIALADLNLPATEKENDDRGISFQLPPSAQTN